MQDEFMFMPLNSHKLYTLQQLLERKEKFINTRIKIINTKTQPNQTWTTNFRTILREFG